MVAELLQKMINPLQKNCLLIIDEIKIRPSIVYSGGILCGKAANDPNEQAVDISSGDKCQFARSLTLILSN